MATWTTKYRKDDMRFEANRLTSFKIWNVPGVSPEDLAASGFYCLTPITVKCAFCHIVLTGWREGNMPLAVHTYEEQFCSYLMKKDDRNVPINNRDYLEEMFVKYSHPENTPSKYKLHKYYQLLEHRTGLEYLEKGEL